MAIPGDLHGASPPSRFLIDRRIGRGASESKGKARPHVVVTIEELPSLVAAGGTVAGIDLGDKTIGLAVSDGSLAFAHPRPVIQRRKFSVDAATLLGTLVKEDVRAVAIGLPI